jgi:hypothetical protein
MTAARADAQRETAATSRLQAGAVRPSWRAMRLLRCLTLFALICLPAFAAAPPVSPDWNRVQVGPMKTSIYIGSVTLTTRPFVRSGDTFSSIYSAKVFPWAFWNETGTIHIHLTPADLAKLARGERCEFTGEAHNQKNKPRHVTGYADPHGPDRGKIKVRIGADDVELIFNGTYRLSVFFKQAGAAQNASKPATPAP